MTGHWLVVGASSAISRACVRKLAEHGDALTLAGRDLDDLEATAADARLRGSPEVRTVYCDITCEDSRQTLVNEIASSGQAFNVLMVAAAMPEQQVMQRDAHALSSMINATYLGPVSLLEALAARGLEQRGARVVIIGSVAGDRGRRSNYLYGSAKAGLAVFAEGLRSRLHPRGSTVTLVKPGFVDTAMTWGLPGLFLVASPDEVAERILKAAAKGRDTVYFPMFWALIMLIIRLIPSTVIKRMSF